MPLGDAASSPLEQQEALRRRADEASAELDNLRHANQHLQQLVNSKHNAGVSICGYLAKYRPFASGLLSQTWEPRFFTLNGTALQYYKSEFDTAKHPRGHIEVQGCIVEYEGVKKQKHYTFGVVDRAGNSLIRVSTVLQGDAQRWMSALQEAGCEFRMLSDEARSRSPLRSADVRWGHASPAPGHSQQPAGPDSPELRHRWNVASSKLERVT
jgi:hypothetical protein